ncbi:sulfite exporter TauE/SafE family protein [Maritimibacter sp. DP1N21-5]|uniref:sulfite exporter TauE/SafE family protein n=1 Tax=Maritimibacter sp. DP1N21-5 TaxID=2836867 RepID=UPI001C47AD2C|nr:sulfite exporter TauE/SafE family protein [Maritimibacter sp. DP1N21-5]MBV7410822.1 sulfite exporter TauE/SafE family protein [Maritimibacter sp. DP1N21-5]
MVALNLKWSKGFGVRHTVEYNLTFFAVATVAVVFAGVSKGGFGSGAAFAATPLLALILEPGQAVGLMLPLLMLMDVTALRPYWRKWDGRAAGVFILGAVPGVAVGTAVYSLANQDVFRLMIGAVAVGFVAFQLARKYGLLRPARRPMGDLGGGIAGAVGGFTSFVSHAGGPPAAIFLLSRGLDKTTYQATTVLMFWAINLMKFVPYALLGIFTWDTLKADLMLVPAAVVGVWLGVRAHNVIPERLYFTITYALLLATGGKLIWDALT